MEAAVCGQGPDRVDDLHKKQVRTQVREGCVSRPNETAPLARRVGVSRGVLASFSSHDERVLVLFGSAPATRPANRVPEVPEVAPPARRRSAAPRATAAVSVNAAQAVGRLLSLSWLGPRPSHRDGPPTPRCDGAAWAFDVRTDGMAWGLGEGRKLSRGTRRFEAARAHAHPPFTGAHRWEILAMRGKCRATSHSKQSHA